MQVTVESTSALGRRMTVEIPADRIDTEVEKRLRDLSRKVRLPGFRPGKVPVKVVRQQYGSQVRNEVLTEVMQSSYQEAVTLQNLRPVSGPDVTPGAPGDGKGLEYIAEFEVYPEFEVASMEGVEIRRPVAEVSDGDVDAMIENLRKQRRTWEAVERGAQDGDRVTLDFEGSIDGDPFEGGSGEGMAIELGEGRMVPGFEEQLSGLRAGDSKRFELTFPDDYRGKEVAGRTATFDIEVTGVEAPVLPEVDEAFAESFGVGEGGVDALRSDVRSNMERELEEKIRARVKDRVMDALLEHNRIELPGALVREEIERLRKQTMEMVGVSDPEKFPDDRFEDSARRRVALGLVIGEIIKKERFRPDEDRISEAVARLAASYEEPQQVIQYYRQNREARASVEAAVLEDTVVDWVLERANVVDEQLGFDELVNQPNPNE